MSSVLVVDDEPAIRELVTFWLTSAGFDVTEAASALEALDAASSHSPALVVTDLKMPGHDGLWLADRLRHQHPTTAVLILTGLGDLETAILSLRAGVQDFLMKPVAREALMEAVERGLRWHEREVEQQREYQRLEAEVHARRRELSETIASLQVTSSAAVDALLRLLTLHDAPAYHATRVAALSTRLAQGLGGDDALVTTVEVGALLHDLGKIAVGVSVLTKPENLSPAEREMIARHPQLGAEIIAHVPFMKSAAAIVAAHHERWDGTGYPNNLCATEIPLGARIVMVADTYDALTNDRPYQQEHTPAAAMIEILRCRGTQFDPDVVDAFSTLMAGG
jgi:putative two-component system response regulator